MSLRTARWREQKERWPAEGRHILAQFDDASVVVYQAYRPSIGRFAAAHGRFGAGFSFDRMSWIKPNFLWMMCRSGWGTKVDQEVTLALRLRRAGFDAILAEAVHSSHVPDVYGERANWEAALSASQVRLQWDPDHSPTGGPLARRAIQLGLRGSALRRAAGEWLLGIEDVSELVAEGRALVERDRLDELVTPEEHVYRVAEPEVRLKLGID